MSINFITCKSYLYSRPEEIGNMTNATCREAIRFIGSVGNFNGTNIRAYQRRLEAALKCYVSQ